MGQANCGILLHRFDLESNLSVTNCSQKDSFSTPNLLVLNVDCDIIAESISKIVSYLNLRIPENSRDKEYKKDILRTSVDIQKFFEGAHSNILVQAFIRSILDSMNIEPKFPITKVSKTMSFGADSFLVKALQKKRLGADHFRFSKRSGACLFLISFHFSGRSSSEALVKFYFDKY